MVLKQGRVSAIISVCPIENEMDMHNVRIIAMIYLHLLFSRYICIRATILDLTEMNIESTNSILKKCMNQVPFCLSLTSGIFSCGMIYFLNLFYEALKFLSCNICPRIWDEISAR